MGQKPKHPTGTGANTALERNILTGAGTDAEFFKNADIAMPQPKVQVTIRLDPDVLEWFKSQGKGYQTRINAILRAYMQEHSRI